MTVRHLVVVGLSGLAWAPRVFGPDWGPLLTATVVGTSLFTVHAAIGGVAAGRAVWSGYSLLVAGETVVRLALFVVVALAIVLMKIVPGVPGSFTRAEWIAFAAWSAFGLLFWLARRR